MKSVDTSERKRRNGRQMKTWGKFEQLSKISNSNGLTERLEQQKKSRWGEKGENLLRGKGRHHKIEFNDSSFE